MNRRVLTVLVTVTVLAVAIFYAVAARAIRERDLHVELLELRNEASSLTAVLAAAGGGWPDVVPVPADDDHAIALYGADGAKLSGPGDALPDPIAREALSNHAASGRSAERLVAGEAFRFDGRVVAVVVVSEPRSLSDAKTDRTLIALAGFALSLVAISAAIGWLLTRSLTSKFDQLQRAASRIGQGDFAHRVPPTGLAEFDRVGGALSATAARVGTLVERERAFSAEASHQLRTPVASLRVALEAELLAPRADAHLILHEGIEILDRLEETVTSLLALARDDPSERRPIDAEQLLRELVQRWSQPFRQVRRVLRLTAVATPSRPVRASAVAISHVLDVLVDNALRHGLGEVLVAGHVHNGGYAFVVSDQGSIDVGDQLFRTRSLLDAGGGIGLGLARTLAAAEGARLRLLTSSPTTFELSFSTGTGHPEPR